MNKMISPGEIGGDQKPSPIEGSEDCAAPGQSSNGETAPRARRDIIDLSDDNGGREQGSKTEDDQKGTSAPESGEKKGEPPPKPPSRKVFAIVGLVLLACLAWGGYSHWRSYSESKQTASDTVNRAVDVRTTEAKREDTPLDLTLPGETEAFDMANIYARATGYIGERRVDIGSRVKQGDLLAHIAAPDLDQQLAQAIAQKGQVEAAREQARTQVTQAEANVNLAKVTFARTNQLTQQGYESVQNRDNQVANVQTQQANVEAAKAGVDVAEANVRAQQATIDRLQALAGFEDVRAPFDGVITARNIDTGDLVNADSSTGLPMFSIARDNIIRVTVRVPQSSATGIENGLEALVHVSQIPNRTFFGKVERTSQALLYSSRALTVEVDVPNDDGALRSGLYVTVSFKIPREHPDVNVPAEALIFNQRGLQVATVENDQVTMHSVTIYRDYGTTVDLREGLQGGERVVLSPPATLADKAKVKETREEEEKQKEEQKKPDGSAKQADAAAGDKTN